MNPKNKLVSVQDAGRLPATATFPRYDRSKLGCGIAHMSVGNFHRAHQALFLHEYLQIHPDESWMIHGICLREPDRDLVRAMNDQDNLYTLTERSGSYDSLKVVGSIKEVWHAPAEPQRVIDLLASDHIKIISLTVTEAGYYYTADHHLDLDDRIIAAELEPGALPVSVLGYLFQAARQRMQQKRAPFTIMSCDNLPENGDLVRSLLLEFADLKERAVGDWIRENVSCPNAMVDRITPAVTGETVDYVRSTFGIDDRCPVVSEAYLQWVLEEDFINGRPKLEQVPVLVQMEREALPVTVLFTDNVRPYEMLKMRLLNGAHSALAYVSYLIGHRRVDLAMQDPLVRIFVRRFMDDDITPTLPRVPGIDIEDYKATLIQRFSNPAVGDQVQRLAQDGSAKVRNFLVPPLTQQLAEEGSIQWIAFALAGWYTYLRGVDESGMPIAIADPMRETLVARATQGGRNSAHLLALEEIFGAEIAANRRLLAEVTRNVDAIAGSGTREALRGLLEP